MNQRAGTWKVPAALNGRLGAMVERAMQLVDSDIGVSTCLQAVASARPETRYTRRFRS